MATRLSAFSTSSPTLSALAEASRLLAEEAEDIQDFGPSEVISDSRVEFSTLRGKVHPDTLAAITVRPFKYTHMSPVQEKILPMLPDLALPYDPNSPHANDPAKPRDLLVKAKTGTGKTMAFLVPAIEARLKAIDDHVEAKVAQLASTGVEPTARDIAKITTDFTRSTVGTVIISPTRELATQIAVEASNLTSHHRGFQVQLFLGGEDKGRQLRSWAGRKDIVVATPGRLIDMVESRVEVKEPLTTAKMVCDFLFLMQHPLMKSSSF